MTLIKINKGDILQVQSGLILHGCNTKGVMGAGIAKQIAVKYPDVYSEYVRYCRWDDILGEALFVKVSPTLVIGNLFTQDSFGRDPTMRYVSYDAVDNAFKRISYLEEPDTEIHFPKIGAGLANGDWTVIQSIIEHRLKDFTNLNLWVLE